MDTKKNLLRYGLVALFFIILSLVVFRCAIGTDKIFSTSDGNIGILAAGHRALPERFTGAYTGVPLLGGGSSIPVTPIRIGQWLMSPEMYSDTWYAIYLTLSSLFLIAFLRMWNIRWMPAVFGALSAFWVGSITVSAAGHLGKFGVIMYFVISLCTFEKGIRTLSWIKRAVWGGLTGISVGLMLLTQQDVGLLAGLFLGVYAIVRLMQRYAKAPLVWVSLLLPIVLIGGGSSYSTARKAYSANVTEVGMQTDSKQKWDFITQWSMVPKESADLIAPGYTGWSSSNTKGPYWGEVGQSAEWKTTGQGFRNFRLDNFYIGFVPVFFALVGGMFAFRLFKTEKEKSIVFLMWGLLALVSLFLAFGKYSVLYKIFYQLPLVGNIRAPVKFMHNFQVMVGILAAFGLNGILSMIQNRGGVPKWFSYVTFGCAVVFILVAFAPHSGRFTEWGQYTDVILSNIRNAWLHAAVVASLLGGVLITLSIKNFKYRQWIVTILLLIIACDSVYLTSKYFNSVDVSYYRKGNVVLNYLKDKQGDERIHFLSNSGPYNSWIGVDGGYHGLNIFNFWQMPRMPLDYKKFLGQANTNLPRMWQLTSCKYVVAPAGVMNNKNIAAGLSPQMYFRFIMEDGHLGVTSLSQPSHRNDQVLALFEQVIPRFALFTNWEHVERDQQCKVLFSPEFNALTTVVVDYDVELAGPPVAGAFRKVSAETDLKTANIHTQSDDGGVLMFTQYWQPGWTVEVDGRSAELLRVNYLSMGVWVPAGEHRIVFRYGK